VKFLVPPKYYHVFGNDALFELPNDATIVVWSIIAALYDED
jgi:hypothetical protein